jgi:hypothetical protein
MTDRKHPPTPGVFFVRCSASRSSKATSAKADGWLLEPVGGAALHRPEPVEGSLSKGASLLRQTLREQNENRVVWVG